MTQFTKKVNSFTEPSWVFCLYSKKRHQWHCSGVSTINSEQISHIVLVFHCCWCYKCRLGLLHNISETVTTASVSETTVHRYSIGQLFWKSWPTILLKEGLHHRFSSVNLAEIFIIAVSENSWCNCFRKVL